MKLKILILIFLFGMIGVSFASDKAKYPIQYAFTNGTKITAEKVDSKYIYMVNFSGELKFDGTYNVDYDESRKTKLIITIKPLQSLDNYLTLKDRGKKVEIGEFFVGEKPKLIMSLLGEKYYKSMMTGSIKHMSGQAMFLIDGFSATYECDKLIYYSGVKKVIQITKNVAIAQTRNSGDC